MDRTNRARPSRRALLKVAGAAGVVLPAVLRRTGVATAAGSDATPAPPPHAGDPADLFREFGEVVERRMAELKIPGVALGVVADKEEFAAGFGVTNVDHPLPVDPETLFQIGSITKTYTGTALMRLVEQGKVDLAAPVRTYLPEFAVADAAAAEAAALRHLVTHTAGWYGDRFDETGDGDDAVARYVAGMADLPQIAPPGAHFSYNNAAFVVAGRVIEAVTGQPYEAAARELVLTPLGLEHSFFFVEEAITEAVAVGHGAPEGDPAGDPVVRRPWAFPRAANPAGGLVASMADLLRYARFHLGHGTAAGEAVLGTAGLRRMRAPLGPGGAIGPELADALGVSWFLFSAGGVGILGHAGGTNGQRAFLAAVPERGFAFALLANAEAANPLLGEAATWVLDRFLGLAAPPPATVPLAPERLAADLGAYGLPDGSGGRVERVGGALRLASTSGEQPVAAAEAVPLRPIGGDRFRFAGPEGPSFVDFARDATGTVAWIRLEGRLMPRLA